MDLAARSFARALVMTAMFLGVLMYGLSLSTQWTLMPHRYCVLNDPLLVWSMVVTNSVIAFVYFAIPAAMVTLVRAMPMIFFSPRIVYLYALFILACGGTHVMVVVTIFYPAYYAQVVVDVVCAIASAATFRELLRSRPAIEHFLSRLRDASGPYRWGDVH